MRNRRADYPRRTAAAPAFAIVAGLAAVAAAAAPVFDLGSKAPIQAVSAVEELEIESGGTAVFPIRLEFPGTHHLNSQPSPSFSVKEPLGLKVESMEVRGDHHFDNFLEVDVYEGTVTVLVRISAEPSLSGEHTLRGELTYYPCSDADLICFEQIDPVRVKLKVVPEASAASPAADTTAEASSAPVSPAADTPAAVSSPPRVPSADTPPAGVSADEFSPLKDTGSTLADRVSESFDKSALLAYVLVFFGGILASFTPCVYPMIPITVAVIGAGSAGSRSKGFGLSLIYVLGIAITYSTLGAAAASTGKAFGSFTQTFPVLLGIGLLLGVLGASMFGFFEIQPPAFLTRLQSKRGPGQVGILLMGVVTGLVASPCLGPVLLALLAWIAKTGDVLRGFTMLFVFAVGMGLLLIAIGTFAGAVTALPKSGAWMVRVRELLGLILAGVGVYYVGLALATKGVPEKATWMVGIGIALAVVGYMVRGSDESTDVEAVPAVSGMKRFLRRGVGVVMVVAGAYLALVGLSLAGVAPSWLASRQFGRPGAVDDRVVWSASYETGMERARAEAKPVIIDFSADWCVYCKKLDSEVFTDERVVAESKRFVTIRIDADRHKDIVRERNVLGLPTVVFIDSAGAESSRIQSYVKADNFLEQMKSVR